MVLISDKQRAALLAKARPLGQTLSTYVRRTLGIEEMRTDRKPQPTCDRANGLGRHHGDTAP